MRSIDPEALRQQAEEIRQSGYRRTEEPAVQQASRWAQAVYLAMLILTIGPVIFLLVSRGSRLWLLEGVARGWSKISSTKQSAEVFKLPPPPPKTVEPKVVLQGSPTFVFRGGGASGATAPGAPTQAAEPETTSETPQDESKPPAPPEKTTGAKAAYDLLVKNSEVAQKLTGNGFPDLQFKEWKPVKNSPPEFWINVVATRAGQNVEFVWMVNTESGTVTALSQNARDLQQRE
ncbi:MAG: hypothetical protein ACE15E_04315 [Acidobacteriota bacterium]